MKHRKTRLENRDFYKTVLKGVDNDEIFNTFYEEMGNMHKSTDNTSYINRELTCPCGKDTYATRQDAENAIKQRDKDNKHSYRCSICGHFHLTSNKKREDKQKNQKLEKKLSKIRRDRVKIDMLDNNESFKRQLHKIANEKNHDKHKNLRVSQDSTNRKGQHKLSGFTLKEILTEKFYK